MVVINALAILAYLASLFYIIRNCRAYSPLIAFLSISHVWALASCFYNDLGVYNIELFRYTDTTLATTRLALFYITFNAGFLAMAKFIGKRKLPRLEFGVAGDSPRLGNLKLLLYASIALIAVQTVYSLFTNGLSVMELNRSEFVRHAGPVGLFLQEWSVPIAFVLGMTRRGRSRFSVQGLLLIGLIANALMTGHKFSLPFTIVVFYFMPIIMRRLYHDPDWRPFRFANVIRFLTVCLVFGAFAYGVYLSKLGDSDQARTLFANRVLTMQGELWWAADNQVSGSAQYDSRHWEDELAYVVSPDKTSSDGVGMRYLMIKVLGAQVAYSIFDSGYLYTMGYPAILIVTFPYLAAILVQFLAGAVFFLMVYYLFFSVAYSHYARTIVALLVTLPFTIVLVTGNLFVFLSLGMFVKIVTLICLETLPLLVRRWPTMSGDAVGDMPRTA